MEKQGQNVTTTTAIKEEFNGDMTIQLDSIKEEVLDKDEKNCEILRDTQSTIVEHQKQQDQQQQQQQQSEIIEIKSAIIIDHQMNNYEPEKIAEQGPSCSPNFDYAGYPGFLEAIRQAKRKKKSHDVSFEILFSYLPESVIKQHDIHLNEWWNYCLFENKDPLETDLSVFIGYLGKKLDVGATPDDLKSISSTICLIASNKMERQIYSSSFLFSEFAKYSSVNNAAGCKTPKPSCQNDSIISSLHIGTKKQDGSKKASVQIENALSELIDISDDHSGNQSSSTALKPPTDVLNNNKPTKKKNVLLQKATNNVQVKTPLMEFPSTNPPAVKKSILTELINLSGDDLETESPSTSRQKDVLNNNGQSNYKKNDVFIEQVFDNSQLITPLIESPTSTIKPPAILLCPASKKKVSKNNEIKELVPESINGQQTQVFEVLKNNTENRQIKIENTSPQVPLISNVVVDDKSNLINEKSPTITMPVLEQPQDEVIQQQQSTLSAANSNQENNLLINNVAPSNTPLLTPSQLNTSALECLSNPLEQNIVKTSGNLQSGSSSDNAVRKKLQQQQKPRKSRSYLQNKSSVLSVYTNQSPEKPDSDRKSISDLSHQILPTNDIEIYAFLQKVINNPQTAIVQDQIEGNTVKMLISMPKDEQTLITFDVPNEKCTVNDLLEQVGVPFNESTTVSLVKDPISKINYIVESEAGTIVNLTETSDVNNELSNDRNVFPDKKYFHNDDDDDNDWLNTDKKNIGTNLKVKSALLCHMVKIGSYKYIPTDHIIINTTGLTLSVPLLEDKTGSVRVHVAYRDIVKLFIYFGKPVSILFFYTNTISASKIRKLLGMNNPNRPYYDPASKDLTHQRIILFPISLKSNSLMILKKVFSSDTIIEELNAKQAYDILLKGASLNDYIDISSKIGKRQTTIVNTNNIVKNSTFHPAAPTKSEDTNKSITKAKCEKLSCIIKNTNVNYENNEKSNNGNDKLTNNDSRQKPSSFIHKKIVLDKSQPARKKHMSNDEFDKRIAANNNIKIFTNSDNIFPHTICSTLKSTNLLLRDKNNTTNSDNNSQRSIKNKIDNNKRKYSQLEVTAEDVNSNNILLSQKENF
ncbi:hypothetical protein HCN44_007104 [Aphidius gifuensis]|uniref:Uncharacterized protein n=1 Tax=Aphidius gifuensis TaxID=684658 RepID=A0A834XP08_APHGI|nr:hypothetical protein HCN44_007104 [Aphidius gifuensis]